MTLNVKCGIIGTGTTIADPYRPVVHGRGCYVAIYKPDLSEVLTNIEPATQADEDYMRANYEILTAQEAQNLGTSWVAGFLMEKFQIRPPRVAGLIGLSLRNLKPVEVAYDSEVHEVDVGSIKFNVRITVT